MAAKEKEDPREKRKSPKAWVVPGYTLEDYLDSGVYGHVFSARDYLDNPVVVKVYDLKIDAMQDLENSARQRLESERIERAPTRRDISDQLRIVMKHEAMKSMKDQLEPDEERHVLFPDVPVPNVRRKGILGYLMPKTVASVSKRLVKIISTEINQGHYNDYRKFIPMIKGVITSLAVFHKKRGGVRRTHNDIKPSNVGTDEKGNTRLFDCGLAETFSSQEGEYSINCQLNIRAPELKPVGEGPSPRTDIWQMGCFMYNLAAGRAPVELRSRPGKGEPGRREYEEKLSQKVEREIARAKARLMGLPISKTFLEIMWKCLDKDPEKRYAHAEELLANFNKKTKTMLSEFAQEEKEYALTESRAESKKWDLDHAAKLEAEMRERTNRGRGMSWDDLDSYEGDLNIIDDVGGCQEIFLGKSGGLPFQGVSVKPSLMMNFEGAKSVSYNGEYIWFIKRKKGKVWASVKFGDIFKNGEPADEYFVAVEGDSPRYMQNLAAFVKEYTKVEAYHRLASALKSQGFYSVGKEEQEKFLEESAKSSGLPENSAVVICPPGFWLNVTASKKAVSDIEEKYGKGTVVYVGSHNGRLARAEEIMGLMNVANTLPAWILSKEEMETERQFIVAVAADSRIARAAANEYARKVAL